MSEKVIVVAFDGMDKELIEEFELENIMQEEFGSIDNDTGIHRRMTSELFASFITGETHEVHEVKGLTTEEKWKEKIVNAKLLDYLVNNVRGFHRIQETIKSALRYTPKKHSKEDYDTDTLFEKIDASLPIGVPAYNPDPYWTTGLPHKFFSTLSRDDAIEESRNDTRRRLEYGSGQNPAFFDVNLEFWDFVMLHLQDPDVFHDTHEGDIKEEYERLDSIAEEISNFVPEDWKIIFMSDHGAMLDEKFEHNKNAFYSCNQPLFPQSEPHVTDFHDQILEVANKE